MPDVTPAKLPHHLRIRAAELRLQSSRHVEHTKAPPRADVQHLPIGFGFCERQKVGLYNVRNMDEVATLPSVS